MTRGIRTGGTLLALVLCSTLVAASSAWGNTTVLNGTVDKAGTAFKSHKITISAVGTITATLDWDNASANLRPQRGPGQRGITWDPTRTWLYIGDVGNKRIVRWDPVSGTCQVVATTATLPAAATPRRQQLPRVRTRRQAVRERQQPPHLRLHDHRLKEPPCGRRNAHSVHITKPLAVFADDEPQMIPSQLR